LRGRDPREGGAWQGKKVYAYAPNPVLWIDPWGLAKANPYTVTSNSASTDIPARGVHVNVSGPGLPPAGGHVSLVPGPADSNGNIAGLDIEPADRAARNLSDSQWRKVQGAIQQHLDDPKNADRLISAAKGGTDLPQGAMTESRRAQVAQVRDILGEHRSSGTNALC
ncbi:hypothetical protein ACFQLY_24100, partial [Paraburkholderia dipogonis]|uniref:hypothetical protein n=1 Tax=Paraburkholderia dipogonis TaxID=1211383 RepID=UPI0036181697